MSSQVNGLSRVADFMESDTMETGCWWARFFGISALAGAVLTAVGVFIERATLHDGPLPSGKKAFILIGSAAACLILSLGGLGYSLWRYRQRTEEAAPLRYLILPPLRYTIPPARFEAEPLLSSNVAPRFPEQRV